ncbi:MAG: histidine triad nucleotide-binding protein [Anaerolineae bacterium]
MTCIFCQIVSGEVQSEILHKDDSVTAFRDINPLAPVHILVVPNKHILSPAEVGLEDVGIVGHMVYVAHRLAQTEGIDEQGYRLVINTGPDAGQLVQHMHMHLLGGRKLGWPPG